MIPKMRQLSTNEVNIRNYSNCAYVFSFIEKIVSIMSLYILYSASEKRAYLMQEFTITCNLNNELCFFRHT